MKLSCDPVCFLSLLKKNQVFEKKKKMKIITGISY